MYTYIYMYMYVYIYTYIYICKNVFLAQGTYEGDVRVWHRPVNPEP